VERYSQRRKYGRVFITDITWKIFITDIMWEIVITDELWKGIHNGHNVDEGSSIGSGELKW
jgi:hypothetical protein